MNLRCWLGLHALPGTADRVGTKRTLCARCGHAFECVIEEVSGIALWQRAKREPPNPRPNPKPRPHERPDVRLLLRDAGGQEMFIFADEPVTAEMWQRLRDALSGGRVSSSVPPRVPPARSLVVEPLNMGVSIPCPGSVIWSRRAVAQTGSPQTLADGSAIGLGPEVGVDPQTGVVTFPPLATPGSPQPPDECWNCSERAVQEGAKRLVGDLMGEVVAQMLAREVTEWAIGSEPGSAAAIAAGRRGRASRCTC